MHDRLAPEIFFEDVTYLPESNCFAAARARIDELANRPFDLEHGPLLRAAAIRHGERHTAVLLCLHHLITDWVSFALFRRELSDCYLHELDERTPAPRQAVGDYQDFVQWQRRVLDGEGAVARKAYWRERLKGHTPTLALPLDRPRPPLRMMAGSRTPFEISRQLAASFRSFALSRGSTVFMGYVALLSALLHRYSGETDVVLGTPVSVRWHPDLRRMLGCLLHVLAIRVEFDGDPTFDATFQPRNAPVLGALENANIPFGTLIETLELERDTSRNPVFQVCLIYLEAEPDAGWFAGMQTDPLEITTSGARFDLTLAIRDTPDWTGGYLEYPTDVWRPESIDEVISHLLRLLEGVVVIRLRRSRGTL